MNICMYTHICVDVHTGFVYVSLKNKERSHKYIQLYGRDFKINFKTESLI